MTLRDMTTDQIVALVFEERTPAVELPEPIKLIPVRQIGDPRVSSRIVAFAMLKTAGGLR